MRRDNAYDPFDLVVIGGGAAGFFTAIRCSEIAPSLRIIILEKSNKLLSKVKVSGGGRCNVTHACFDPKEMIRHYPRGRKELLGPFHRFLCGDMMAWLADHGVDTKIESDGRVFPTSNKSQDIIDCFLDQCSRNNIQIFTQEGVRTIKRERALWNITTADNTYYSKNVMVSTGSSPAFWKILANLGHQIIPPVPSLFTFNIKSELISGLQGLSVSKATVYIPACNMKSSGPVLITHWGLSGPGILKLSSWAARELHGCGYRFLLQINWTSKNRSEVLNTIKEIKQEDGKSSIMNLPLFDIPKRLWRRIIEHVPLAHLNYADLSKVQMDALVRLLCACPFQVDGKSTFKEEFVTCGGVHTDEINFKTMESKLFSGLYFAGEVINIDAVTGGFNFQAAWTESEVAAHAISHSLSPTP